MKPDLYKTLLSFKTVEDLKGFLKDVCTPKELLSLEERLWVAFCLSQGKTYRAIHDETGASLVTITRVARFLKAEPYGGYRTLFNGKGKDQ